jgi:hypothetical protein
MDQDDAGPSRCDPGQAQERGVWWAIRRVFAGFYSYPAVIYRLQYGIEEDTAGLALLVSSSPADGLANGVAFTTYIPNRSYSKFDLVSQVGNHSVTSPEPGTVPEEVDVMVFSSMTSSGLDQRSSMVVVGDTVLEWQDEYTALADLMLRVAKQVMRETVGPDCRLRYEYRKLAPDQLMLTGLRLLPRRDWARVQTPFLVGAPTHLCVRQGSGQNLTDSHRLKSWWTLETESMWLTEENLADRFFTEATVEWLQGCEATTFSGRLDQLPGASYLLVDGSPTLSWRDDSFPIAGQMSFRVPHLPQPFRSYECPVITTEELYGFRLSASWSSPVSTWGLSTAEGIAGPGTTTTQEVLLVPCYGASQYDRLRQHLIDDGSGVRITTTYYIARTLDPRIMTVGYSVPLTSFVETVIEGLTSTPLVLRDRFSQTYMTFCCVNDPELFLFDPWVDPDVPADQLMELSHQGVGLIAAYTGSSEQRIELLADDDGCRQLSFAPRRGRARGRH